MGCMKCGRDTQEDCVFCEVCREDMARYPVKPNVAVQLPSRKEPGPGRRMQTQRRRSLTPEQRMMKLRKRVRVFLALWLVTLALLAAAAYPAAKYLLGDRIRLPGQNYSTFDTTEETNP